VCLVEGPTDLLALRLWGAPGLAMCGTAVDPQVVRELDRFRRIYVILDNDTAGREATARLLQAFGSRGVAVQLPAGVKDVAELASDACGNMRFATAIRQALGSTCSLTQTGDPVDHNEAVLEGACRSTDIRG
jgi:DNA primase